MPNFSTISARHTELTKKNVLLHWDEAQETAFSELHSRLTEALLLALPDFSKVFEVEYDASGNGLGGVLSQEGKPIAYFSEKIRGAQLNYLTYDKELYGLV